LVVTFKLGSRSLEKITLAISSAGWKKKQNHGIDRIGSEQDECRERNRPGKLKWMLKVKWLKIRHGI
jgi:hypothetical protein